MQEPLNIVYREFYDVPRVFIVSRGGVPFLFDGSFDDAADDYPDHYSVYELSRAAFSKLEGSWAGLANLAVKHLGQVPVASVEFDPTLREQIDGSVLRRFGIGTGSAKAATA